MGNKRYNIISKREEKGEVRHYFNGDGITVPDDLSARMVEQSHRKIMDVHYGVVKLATQVDVMFGGKSGD
jgi:hypothetical protein